MSQTLLEKKEKAKWARIKRVYGITQTQYELLNTGTCPICLREFSADVRPCIDHDHTTGDVRGVVCLYCNRVRIGRFRDPDLVYRIADYLALPRVGWIVPKRKRRSKKRKKK